MREYTYICLNGFCFTILHCNTLSKGIIKVNKPSPYRADYFDHKLHLDQNGKLVRYGATHVVAIDGHSRFVIVTSTSPIKSNIIIYGLIYR